LLRTFLDGKGFGLPSILVGLRWWNEVKEDGKEVWIFESDYESDYNHKNS
jgi:hypothetical protein